jgi:hypothetical protein
LKCPSPKTSGGDNTGKGKDEKKNTGFGGAPGSSANAAIAEEDGV